MDPTTSDDYQIASTPISSLSAPADPPPDLDEPTHRQSAGLRWILGSGLIAVVGIGGWLGYQTVLRQPPAPVEVMTAPVIRRDLEVSITETGEVELGGQQTFKAPSDVTVQAVLVEERQRVTQGQVLLELRDRAVEQTLDDQLVQNQISELTLLRHQEVLQERRLRLADAESRLQDSTELLDRGFISEDDFRRDRQAVEEAQSQLRDAEIELAKSELQIQRDQVKTDNLRQQLEDNQILSPINALVLKVEVKPGDGVEREGRLLSIGDPTQETIRLQLTTLNASTVNVGMPVEVRVIGPNPEVFPGRITRVSPQAISSGQNAEQSTVEAEARLNQPSNVLIPGSAVSVNILQQQRQDVLVVPVTALQRDAEQPYVWVQDDENTAQRQEVEVGLETLQLVEVTAGLEVGDDIVVSVPPETPLTPGQPLITPADRDTERDGDRPGEGA